MDNFSLKAMARRHGFAEAYVVPLPEYPDGGRGLCYNARTACPWAGAAALLVYPYSPYAEGERIPSYYINSNRAYHAAKALVQELTSLGVHAERRELPVKPLIAGNGIGVMCKNSLAAIPGFGTRFAAQTLILETTPEHYFVPEVRPIMHDDICAECRICEAACPCHAIDSHGLTVEKCMRFYMDGPVYPDWVYAVQTTHMGCEICQQSCPRNAHIPVSEPDEDIRRAFDLDRLLSGDAADARRLVGRNFTGNSKLQIEAKRCFFCKQNG